MLLVDCRERAGFETVCGDGGVAYDKYGATLLDSAEACVPCFFWFQLDVLALELDWTFVKFDKFTSKSESSSSCLNDFFDWRFLSLIPESALSIVDIGLLSEPSSSSFGRLCRAEVEATRLEGEKGLGGRLP